jgi:hypothetical protein
MGEVRTIGLYIAKSILQVRGVDNAAGRQNVLAKAPYARDSAAPDGGATFATMMPCADLRYRACEGANSCR